MQLSAAGWLQRGSMLMPVAIGVAMPELSGTEVAAACFSEAKAYFRAEAQG